MRLCIAVKNADAALSPVVSAERTPRLMHVRDRDIGADVAIVRRCRHTVTPGPREKRSTTDRLLNAVDVQALDELAFAAAQVVIYKDPHRQITALS